jgi:two-component system, OmpR family, phosphate regulon response regulator OmpR
MTTEHEERPHVLVVDDDTRLRRLLGRFLTDAGFLVSTAADAAEARTMLASLTFDVIVLDVMMPGESGFELTRHLSARQSAAPVLLLTAHGEPEDRIRGLEAGAEDYLPKPFEPRELLARLKAILRRGRASPRLKLLRFGRLEIDRDARMVRVDGIEKPLTSFQFALLAALAENAGRVLSRDALMDFVRGESVGARIRRDGRWGCRCSCSSFFSQPFSPT